MARAVPAFKAEVRGHSLHLPLCPHNMPDHIAEDMANGVYGDFEIDLMRSLIRHGDTVLDVGAHVGYFSVLFASWVGSGKVIAFEPEEDNFALLGHNVHANGYSGIIETHHAGLSDCNCSVSLLKRECNSGDNRVRNDRLGTPARMLRLDDLQEHFPRVNFVKIDTQGHEVWVLQGMREILSRQKQVSMLLEYWPYGLRESGSSEQQYFDLLHELGFRLFLMDDRQGTVRRVTSPEGLVAEGSMDFHNMLCHKP